MELNEKIEKAENYLRQLEKLQKDHERISQSKTEVMQHLGNLIGTSEKDFNKLKDEALRKFGEWFLQHRRENS